MGEKDSINMGLRLRERRIDSGVKLVYIARKLNKPASTLYALEKGTIQLKLDEYVKMGIAYGVNPGEFLTEVIEKSYPPREV